MVTRGDEDVLKSSGLFVWDIQSILKYLTCPFLFLKRRDRALAPSDMLHG